MTLINVFGYVMGCAFAVIAVFKFKDHVDNPHNTPISIPMKKFFAGGMLLSLPMMANIAASNIFGQNVAKSSGLSTSQALAASTGDAGALDTMVVNFVTRRRGSDGNARPGFRLSHGSGISSSSGITRLTHRMDEGPRGPGGIGTIMTFVVSGNPVFFPNMIEAFLKSMFGTSQVNTGVQLTGLYTTGGSGTTVDPSVTQLETVVQGVMVFIMLVGLIAFVRGWFVLRAFADGQQGATLAQGLTFLFAGALAINLGDLINAVEKTLGLTGITFSYEYATVLTKCVTI